MSEQPDLRDAELAQLRQLVDGLRNEIELDWSPQVDKLSMQVIQLEAQAALVAAERDELRRELEIAKSQRGMKHSDFDALISRVDEIAVARLDMGHSDDAVDRWGGAMQNAIQKVKTFAQNYATELLCADEAERDELRRELKDARDELSVYRLASETAMYEAGEFDAGLFLSGDRGVEFVMRRVLRELERARQSRARLVQLVRGDKENSRAN